MRIIKHTRYAEEGGQLIRETHVFHEFAGGFSLPRDIFPQGEGKTYCVSYAASPLYSRISERLDYPLDYPLRDGVTEITEADYQTRLEERRKQVKPRKPTPQESLFAGELSDAAKIFFIDYYGEDIKRIAREREWFNRLYGFDPVKDDPRN